MRILTYVTMAADCVEVTVEFSLLGVEKKLPFGRIALRLKILPTRNYSVHSTLYFRRASQPECGMSGSEFVTSGLEETELQRIGTVLSLVI